MKTTLIWLSKAHDTADGSGGARIDVRDCADVCGGLAGSCIRLESVTSSNLKSNSRATQTDTHRFRRASRAVCGCPWSSGLRDNPQNQGPWDRVT